MKEILQNIALFMLIDFCKDNDIDCSGTYLRKDGRGFTYSLRDQETETRRIASITFHKSQVPTYKIFNQGTPKIFTQGAKPNAVNS